MMSQQKVFGIIAVR